MARIASTEYFDSPLTAFLCPHRHKYPNDVVRRFARMMHGRYLDPRSIGFVAVSAAAPGIPVGYAQFIRLGDDKAAKRLVAEQAAFWRTVKRWWFGLWSWIENLVWPDRSVDMGALRVLHASAEVDDWKYWQSDEMKARYQARWHVQSLVVSSEYQRRGLGRMLLTEALRRAQDEGVVVGLEASEDGEKLYRSLGFELRGRFSANFGDELGGIMMWSPQKVQ